MTKKEIWEQAYEEGFQDGMFSLEEDCLMVNGEKVALKDYIAKEEEIFLNHLKCFEIMKSRRSVK